MKLKINKDKLLLGVVFIVIAVITSFRVAVHPNGYLSPDSKRYIEKAEEIKKNWKETSLSTALRVKRDFAIWPVGYPTCIAFISLITTLPPFQSSKIVNLLFLGLLFILLYKWMGEKAWFICLSFFSYGALEVISYSWSEIPFMFFIFSLAFIIENEKKYSPTYLAILVCLSLILIFLFRYIGLVYYITIAIIIIRHWIRSNKTLATIYTIALFCASIFASLYLYDNKLMTGYYTGLVRVSIGHQTILGYTKGLAQGLLNEFSVARNHFFKETPDLLYILLLLIQLVLIFITIKNKNYLKLPFLYGRKVKILLLFAFTYLFTLIVLKGVFTHVDKFDYRMLFPFTQVVFIALLNYISEARQKEYYRKCAKYIIFFMILSLIINLPKMYILGKIKESMVISSKDYNYKTAKNGIVEK